LIVALLALYFFRKPIEVLSYKMLDDFPTQLGWGFIWLVVAPIAIIVIFATIIGYMLGIIGILVYILSLITARVLSSFSVGILLYRLFKKGDKPVLDWKLTVIGVTVLQLVWFVPVLGWIVGFALMLATLGVIITSFRKTPPAVKPAVATVVE